MAGWGFYEFFAGGGMAREGLGTDWRCLFANDFDPKKGEVYAANWGDRELYVGDVAGVAPFQLPGIADLAWASFPCQDLSLAGVGAGLKGERSGAFWPFWRLMTQLARERRGPRVIILENVCGLITSNSGQDFSALCRAISNAGYRVGAVVIDALHFVPQSRPRLFVIGLCEGLDIPDHLVDAGPSPLWHTAKLIEAYGRLALPIQSNWLWFHLPKPLARNIQLFDLIDDEPEGVQWHSAAETDRLLRMMSKVNRAKVDAAKACRKKVVGAIYKRTRHESGVKVQRAEVRFDNNAGCLRTPGGGSSRQAIIVVDGGIVRTRLLSARETARLMGLPEHYKLPARYNDAYHVTGDGVAVPVVGFLADELLHPLLTAQQGASIAAE
jgi:DNA (cytosine-5)-methyltransferase 1